MKECALCDTENEDDAIRCKKCNKSIWKLQKGKKVYKPKDMQLVEKMLRESSVPYTEEEIKYLVREIIKICYEARTPITEQVVDRIKRNIERKSGIIPTNIQEKASYSTSSLPKQSFLESMADHHIQTRNVAIEQALPVFRGGNNDHVRKDDLTQLVADTINTVLYKYLQIPSIESRIDIAYTDNQSFWNDALSGRLFQGMRIRLNSFNLLEWIPSSPGRYFTPDATSARTRAQSYVDFGRGEYLPLGKEEMVLGGVGSIRLGSKFIGQMEVFPLCASSNGISHQGIPVILTESLFHELAPDLKDFGGCVVNLIGHLRIFPVYELPIYFDKQIPRYCIFVEEIQILRPSEKLLATVAITFSPENGFHYENARSFPYKHWSFCSFDPIHQNVEVAVKWLEDYASRYSHGRISKILGDFDEHFKHFDYEVEFPIAQILNGHIDNRMLSNYHRDLNFTINFREGDTVMGDKLDFGNAIISSSGGQIFVGKFRDTIANLNGSGKQDFAVALTNLKDAIENSKQLEENRKPEILEAVSQLGDEAAKTKPNKTILKALGDGLTATLKTIPDIAKAVAALAPLLTNLIK